MNTPYVTAVATAAVGMTFFQLRPERNPTAQMTIGIEMKKFTSLNERKNSRMIAILIAETRFS